MYSPSPNLDTLRAPELLAPDIVASPAPDALPEDGAEFCSEDEILSGACAVSRLPRCPGDRRCPRNNSGLGSPASQ